MEVELNSFYSKWTSDLKNLPLLVGIEELFWIFLEKWEFTLFLAMCILLFDSYIRRPRFRPEMSLEMTKSQLTFI